MDKRIAGPLFHAVWLWFAPFSLAGYAAWVSGGLFFGRALGVSSTAQGPLSARYFLHQFGTRRDDAASRLMLQVPGVNPLSVLLVVGPSVFAQRLTGYVPKVFRYPYRGELRIEYESIARTTFFDGVLAEYAERVAQLVILGAGFDTRCYGLPPNSAIRCFELDAPKTQALKRDMLARANIDASHVTFVSADFEREDWLARAIAAGFDPTRPSLFIWEGVTMYLDRASIESTLRKVASTAEGSVVAFDYFTTEPLASRKLFWRYARATTESVGEALTFGIDSTPPVRERVGALLDRCGLTLAHQENVGEERGRKRAWAGFASGVVSRHAAQAN
jgi:methyltransferase (TIGR00027 family)